MRKLLIAVVAALLVISLLAAPVMAAGPENVRVPDNATQGADEADDHSADQAPEVVPDRILPTPWR